MCMCCIVSVRECVFQEQKAVGKNIKWLERDKSPKHRQEGQCFTEEESN